MSEGMFPIAASPTQTKETGESLKGISNKLTVGLWSGFLISLVWLCAGLANWTTVAFTAVTISLFVLPGLLIAPVFYGNEPGLRVEQGIVGALFGVCISSYAAIAAGFRYGWSPKTITVAILLLSTACAAVGYRFRGRVKLPQRKWTGIDYQILAGMVTLVVAFSAMPAMHVGKLTPRGYAYTWLYGNDFFTRSDFSVAMTVKMPPDFYWMTGVPLRMYLIGYAMPAFAFAASGKTIALHSMMLLMILFAAVLMAACLFLFLRTMFAEPKWVGVGAFLALVAYSYYWVYDVAKAPFLRPGHRFDFHDSISHLFQRSFLVEPQAALATSLLLVILALMALMRYRLRDYSLAAFIGVCLGLSFGAEGMQGLVMVGWFGLFYSLRLLLVKASRQEELGPFLTAVASCGIVCGSYIFLGMYERSTSHLMTISLNTWIVKYGLGFFPIEFGPLVILGVWGTIRWWRGERESFGWPLLLLAALGMLQVLFIQTPVPQRTRMADRLLPIVFISFAVYLLRELWSSRGNRGVRLLAAGLVLAAVPTFFTDIHYTSNIDDLYNTRYVRVADQEACDWIRQNLPENAVIQGYYNYFIDPDRGIYISLISSFAQRPQVLGWYTGAATIVADGWPVANQRRSDIEKTLATDQVSALVSFVRKYSVDYVYVGPSEQERFEHLLPLIEGAPDQFQQVYLKDGVAIFHYVGHDINSQTTTQLGSS